MRFGPRGLTFVESGTKFTAEYGDNAAPFYSHLVFVVYGISDLLFGSGAEFIPRFRNRIQQLPANAQWIGWGFGDALREFAFRFEDEPEDPSTGPQE